MQEYRQCIDCQRMMESTEINLPYKDGVACLSCYLKSVDHPNRLYRRKKTQVMSITDNSHHLVSEIIK